MPLRWKVWRKIVSSSKGKGKVTYEGNVKSKLYPTSGTTQKLMSDALKSNKVQIEWNRRQKKFTIIEKDQLSYVVLDEWSTIESDYIVNEVAKRKKFPWTRRRLSHPGQ